MEISDYILDLLTQEMLFGAQQSLFDQPSVWFCYLAHYSQNYNNFIIQFQESHTLYSV